VPPNASYNAGDAELTRSIGVFNAHDDFPVILAKQRFEGIYDSLRTYWIPQFRAGGVNVVVGAIFTPTIYVPEGALRHALWALDAMFTEVADNAGDVEIALSVPDIERITARGKIAVLVALEGAEPAGQDLATLRILHRVGLRMVSLTHARRTLFADGNFENETRGGLSRAGRRAVKEMNRLRIVVDITHASDQTTRDILETTTAPVIASHSNARAVHHHPRNLTDDMLRAIAATGGVVGAVAVPNFISAEAPTVRTWVDHIEHMIEVAGIDHVGIGTDFFHYGWNAGAAPGIAESDFGGPRSSFVRAEFAGMQSPEDLPRLTTELRRRGLGEAELRQIYRTNFLRVLSAVEAGG
jgi:membrane dipeptidase